MKRAASGTRRPVLLEVGVGIISALAVVAAFGPLLAPYGAKEFSGESLERPSSRHLLGTNDVGQDIFSQLVVGTRPSLSLAIGSAALAMAIAVLVGSSTALIGGWVDTLFMRFLDVLLAVPVLPLLLLVGTLVGTNRLALTGLIAVISWPVHARMVRSQALTLRARGFVETAAGLGGGLFYVARRHMAPALCPVIVAGFVNLAAMAVLLDAGLAFLGIGDPTVVSWGSVLDRALAHRGLYFSPLWTWWVVPAGLAISVTVLGLMFVGTGLEPRMNPRWNRAG